MYFLRDDLTNHTKKFLKTYYGIKAITPLLRPARVGPLNSHYLGPNGPESAPSRLMSQNDAVSMRRLPLPSRFKQARRSRPNTETKLRTFQTSKLPKWRNASVFFFPNSSSLALTNPPDPDRSLLPSPSAQSPNPTWSTTPAKLRSASETKRNAMNRSKSFRFFSSNSVRTPPIG